MTVNKSWHYVRKATICRQCTLFYLQDDFVFDYYFSVINSMLRNINYPSFIYRFQICS